MPFLLMTALRGFIRSSAVILWSLLSPLGALLFDGTRRAMRWLVAYLSLAIISGYLEFQPLILSSLSPATVTVFFILNISTVSAIAIFLLTRAAYELIRDEFVCEPRGPVNIKGKGEMEIWLVLSAG